MDEKLRKDENKLYHERQVKELCALHALNNLFQTKQAFTKKELDEICNRLSPGSFINPHRSILGIGNYDVNVLMAALQEKGYETIWFDKRKVIFRGPPNIYGEIVEDTEAVDMCEDSMNITIWMRKIHHGNPKWDQPIKEQICELDVDVLVMDNIMGLILNTPTEYKLGFMKLPIHRKHWIAIRCLQGQYMNLDSKLDAPSTIGDESSLLQYLRSELSNGEKELLLVVEPDVYEKSMWKRDTSKENSSAGIHLTKELSVEVVESTLPHQTGDKVANGIIDQGTGGMDVNADQDIRKMGNCHMPAHLEITNSENEKILSSVAKNNGKIS